MAVAVMAHYDFSFGSLFAHATELKGVEIMSPGGLVSDPISML